MTPQDHTHAIENAETVTIPGIRVAAALAAAENEAKAARLRTLVDGAGRTAPFVRAGVAGFVALATALCIVS